MVEYTYDAWGNHTVGGSNVALGNRNPFRYRSYFYDTETDLYFLKTRYYDPAIGRFINMDSVAYADPETVNGLNLYAYCLNNPVSNVDPDGTFIITLLSILGTLAIGSLIGGVGGSVVEQGIESGWGNVSIKDAFIAGGISAVFSAITFGFTSFAVRNSVGLFENVVDKSLRITTRIVNSLSFSLEAAISTGIFSFPTLLSNGIVSASIKYLMGIA